MSNEIYHYGILGMKWGRRSNKVSVTRSKPHKTELKKAISKSKEYKGKRTAYQKIAIGSAKLGSKIVSEKTLAKTSKFANDYIYKKESKSKKVKDIQTKEQKKSSEKKVNDMLSYTTADGKYMQYLGGGAYAEWPSKSK